MKDWREPERLARGNVLILPGIEGRSWLNVSIARGLIDGGFDGAVEIYDWTAGPLWMLHNLRSRRRRREQAAAIAGRVQDYQQQFPGRPTWLIGHSGGAALALYALAELPPDARITGAVLLTPAVSPGFNLRPALARTERGLWAVTSWGDVFLLGLGTSLAGTYDGHHTPAAGMTGFSRTSVDPDDRAPADIDPGRATRRKEALHAALDNAQSPVAPDAAPSPASATRPRLYDLPYQLRMMLQRNFGGHFGCTSRRFVSAWIAPILREPPTP